MMMKNIKILPHIEKFSNFAIDPMCVDYDMEHITHVWSPKITMTGTSQAD